MPFWIASPAGEPPLPTVTYTPRFVLVEHDGLTGIRCLDCCHTSWNPTDVAERYTACCHRFHREESDAYGRAMLESLRSLKAGRRGA